MARVKRDIMVVRFTMQTRSNMKLRSYQIQEGCSPRKRLIRVLYFRNKNKILPSVYQADTPIYFRGAFYNLPVSDMGGLTRYF